MSTAVRTHDAFNLMAIPGLIGLTGAALLAQSSLRAQQRLAFWFGVYNVVDIGWLLQTPEALPNPNSAPLLCAHHLASLALLLYGITWTPHLLYGASHPSDSRASLCVALLICWCAIRGSLVDVRG